MPQWNPVRCLVNSSLGWHATVLALEGILTRLDTIEGCGKGDSAEDDFDLFDSEDEQEVDPVKQELLERYAKKKAESGFPRF